MVPAGWRALGRRVGAHLNQRSPASDADPNRLRDATPRQFPTGLGRRGGRCRPCPDVGTAWHTAARPLCPARLAVQDRVSRNSVKPCQRPPFRPLAARVTIQWLPAYCDAPRLLNKRNESLLRRSSAESCLLETADSLPLEIHMSTIHAASAFRLRFTFCAPSRPPLIKSGSAIVSGIGSPQRYQCVADRFPVETRSQYLGLLVPV